MDAKTEGKNLIEKKMHSCRETVGWDMCCWERSKLNLQGTAKGDICIYIYMAD